ncbi:MAG: DUF4468 domain-containing protein [Polaribacter sp.]|uniref:DUF4468 domain-containing protein n=1 Tax=Polaribacter sp. TaxID=1920175 RepID=UPI003EF30FC2
MKKLNLIIGILLLTTSFSFGQKYELDKKTVSGVFDVKGKTKSEIFSSINKWISLNYNSAQNVVQLNDSEAGNIIVKGQNDAVYKEVLLLIYPKRKLSIPEYASIKLRHTIEINVRDNKFRIIYSLTSPAPYIGIDQYGSIEKKHKLIFSMIDFSGLKDEQVKIYNEATKDGVLFMGKKKKGEMINYTKPIFEQFNKDLIADIKSTFLSIKETVNLIKKDDW